MDKRTVSATALSFVGDAIYSLKVREFYVEAGYRQGRKLQELSKRYVSAAGQTKAYYRLKENGFLTEEEEAVFLRGRNAITHIPRNGDRQSYETASGLEALCGYLYLFEKERCEELFREIFKGGEENA